MKFSSLNRKNAKRLRVKSFSGGTDLYNSPFNIADNSLADMKNMICEGGVLKSRQGLIATTENIIKSDSADLDDVIAYRVTDTSVCIDGEYKKIVTADYLLSDAHYYCYIFFLGADGSLTDAGYICYNRVSDNCFYQPVNLLFYTGEPINGGGIFLLATAADAYNGTQYSYRIYEISADMTAWNAVTDYYTPVVYINGRGTRYEEAKATNSAYTGQPRLLESRNMLTSRFKAYYTSDGYSSCFRLPFTELADESIVCRIYTAPDDYTEWFIEPTMSTATATFYTASITLKVDREKGIMYFTDSQGEYPIPVMGRYHENNIRVTAGKEVENGFKRAVSSTCCTVYGTKTVFSGGCDKGTVLCISRANPLYFPETSYAAVGGRDKAINALTAYENGIIAYKSDEIYELKLKNGAALNSSALLADDGSVFFEKDRFAVGKIDVNIGCLNKSTAVICGDRAVWLGNDGNIYSLNTASKSCERLSEAISPYLEKLSEAELERACAYGNSEQYMLMTGSKAVIMKYGEKKSEWYIWDFGGIGLMGAISNKKKQRFFCTGNDGKIFYSAEPSGSRDTDISLKNGTPTAVVKNIYCSATTRCFDFGGTDTQKLIESIAFSAGASGKLDILFNGMHFDTLRLDTDNTSLDCGMLGSVKIIPHLYGIRSLYITFKSEAEFALSELIINYREVG